MLSSVKSAGYLLQAPGSLQQQQARGDWPSSPLALVYTSLERG